MVSHVDDDHIHGLLEMAEELRDAELAQEPFRWDVKTLWHNGFDDIIGNNQIGTAVHNTPTASLAGIGHDEGLILASVRQGREAEADHGWINAIHGLGALLDQVVDDGLSVSMVEAEDAGLRIDLGDPLG